MKKKGIHPKLIGDECYEDIYSEEGIEILAEDDEISSAEQGFMQGYVDA